MKEDDFAFALCLSAESHVDHDKHYALISGFLLLGLGSKTISIIITI